MTLLLKLTNFNSFKYDTLKYYLIPNDPINVDRRTNIVTIPCCTPKLNDIGYAVE